MFLAADHNSNFERRFVVLRRAIVVAKLVVTHVAHGIVGGCHVFVQARQTLFALAAMKRQLLQHGMKEEHWYVVDAKEQVAELQHGSLLLGSSQSSPSSRNPLPQEGLPYTLDGGFSRHGRNAYQADLSMVSMSAKLHLSMFKGSTQS